MTRLLNFSRRIFAVCGITTILSLWVPGLALAGPGVPGIVQISPELMDALDSWSAPGAHLEPLAAELFPETIINYSQKVEAIYQGLSIAEHFANKYPEVFAEVLEVTRDGALDSASFAAHVMTHMPDAYAIWQQEEDLILQGLTFPKYIANYHPEVLEKLEIERETPASRGELFIDFVQKLDNAEALYPQALAMYEVVDAIPFPPELDCECWLSVSFGRTPGHWGTQDSINDTPRPQAFQEGRVSMHAGARGAARNVDFYRHSRNQQHTGGKILNVNVSDMRVRLNCTQSASPSELCDNDGCSGEMALRVFYASELYEEVFSGWFFPHGSQSLAADEAELVHTTLGTRRTLFQKTGAVAGNTKVTWDPESLGTILGGITEVAVGVVGEAGVGAITGDLVNSLVQGFAGLITVEGQNGPLRQDWYVAYDTTFDGPIELAPNESHLFRLDSRAEVYGEGFGLRSDSWASVESGYSFAAVFRDFSCHAEASAPDPGACWSWATEGDPVSVSDMQDGIESFVSVELGSTPSSIPNDHCE